VEDSIKKETVQFLSIARGSLNELETQLYISNELLYITEDQLSSCLTKIEVSDKLIYGFIKYTIEKKE
jgi:four helix bundle protein